MKKSVIDQLGRIVEFNFPPKHIVSLVPSQTELLFSLGFESEIVGITKFCVHPSEKVKSISKIGGTKNLQLNQIDKLNPDLIIANKEENNKDEIFELSKKYPVWISDVKSFSDSINLINYLGSIFAKEDQAFSLCTLILKHRQHFRAKVYSPINVIYLIWKNPYMVVGRDSFISSMLDEAGYHNCVKESRYPTLSPEDIKNLNPDLIMLSSEPYPFKEKHLDEFNKVFPNIKKVLVNGEYFSWYGSRMTGAFEYFNTLRLKH